MTVNEVSKLTGLTIRTLQYYDRIGLFKPSTVTEAGYRIYDENDLEKLFQIMMFRELEMPLKEIKRIVQDPGFDRTKALAGQKEMLLLKLEHIKGLIELTDGMIKGEKKMSFKDFDNSKLEEYAQKARKEWGNTRTWSEYEEKSRGRSADDSFGLGKGLMDLFRKASVLIDTDPAGEQAARLVREIQSYITDNFYTCTDEILASLGRMYGAGGEYTENIDSYAGEGTARFVSKAIRAYTLK